MLKELILAILLTIAHGYIYIYNMKGEHLKKESLNTLKNLEKLVASYLAATS